MLKSLLLVALLALLAAFVIADPVTVVVRVGSSTKNEKVFVPEFLTINVNDTVQWVWDGPLHNVISGSNCTDKTGVLNSGTAANPPFSYNFTFTAEGEYPYYCSIHCTQGMTGVVSVFNGSAVVTSSTTTGTSSIAMSVLPSLGFVMGNLNIFFLLLFPF